MMVTNVVRAWAMQQEESQAATVSHWPTPFPADSVLAVIDDRSEALRAVQDLWVSGFGPDGLWEANGVDGAHRVSTASENKNWWSRLSSAINDETELNQRLASELTTGATALLIHTSVREADDVMALLREHDARFVHHVGPWVTAGHREHQSTNSSSAPVRAKNRRRASSTWIPSLVGTPTSA